MPRSRLLASLSIAVDTVVVEVQRGASSVCGIQTLHPPFMQAPSAPVTPSDPGPSMNACKESKKASVAARVLIE